VKLTLTLAVTVRINVKKRYSTDIYLSHHIKARVSERILRLSAVPLLDRLRDE